MPIQRTPHTQKQQNSDPAQADLEPNQHAADSAQQENASLHENAKGAQSGGHAVNTNAPRRHCLDTEPRTAALDGGIDTRTPESEKQGISNHSASDENTRQRNVVSERADAIAGVDQTGHRVRSGR
jgi:hypothetical protein